MHLIIRHSRSSLITYILLNEKLAQSIGPKTNVCVVCMIGLYLYMRKVECVCVSVCEERETVFYRTFQMKRVDSDMTSMLLTYDIAKMLWELAGDSGPRWID